VELRHRATFALEGRERFCVFDSYCNVRQKGGTSKESTVDYARTANGGIAPLDDTVIQHGEVTGGGRLFQLDSAIVPASA
jgi:hypothetical protein